MRHPFFDSTDFPWHLREGTDLYKILVVKVVAVPRIANIYARCNGQMTLRRDCSAEDCWTEVFNLLARQGLFRALCELVVNDADLVEAHAVTQSVIRYESPLYRPILSNGEFFLDREVLRANLDDLAMRATRKSVLLVRGPASAGKSWTRNLVTEQAKVLGVNFTEFAENIVATVREVVDHLFDMLEAGDEVPEPGASMTPEQLETDTAWYRKVCNRLHAIAAAKKKVLWIIVDDIGEYPADKGPRLSEKIRMFFNHFVLHMHTEAFAVWFRLILIDYPIAPLPSKWEKYVLMEDTPSPEDANEEALVTFLQRAARYKLKEMSKDDATILARKVLANVTAAMTGNPALQRLPAINQELRRIYPTL